jgi:hypothetical protein
MYPFPTLIYYSSYYSPMLVVRVTPRPRFTPGERTPGRHWIGGRVGPRTGLDTEFRGRILLPLLGIEPQSPGRPALSQTLYWLSYTSCRPSIYLKCKTQRPSFIHITSHFDAVWAARWTHFPSNPIINSSARYFRMVSLWYSKILIHKFVWWHKCKVVQIILSK